MLRKTPAIITMTLLLIIGGCGFGGAANQLREQDSGRSVEVQVGEKLEIILEGNPTTGYTWEQTTGDGAIVKLDGDPLYTSESNLVGAGGTYLFRFSAVAPGETSLTLIYHRSFESGVPPLKTFTVLVTVR
jgi:inhibitor of cysteine peptidase